MVVIRWSIRIVVALTLLVVVGLAIDALTFDRDAAKRDYVRLKQGMAQHYANLDWQVSQRELDLVELDQNTSDALDRAWGRLQTYQAIDRFIAAFRDPHLKLAYGSASPEILVGMSSDVALARRERCEEVGFERRDKSSRLKFDELAGWESHDSDNFPAGRIGEFAVIRIAEFGENRYLDACSKVASPNLTQREMQLATRTLLQQELVDLVTLLRDTGVTSLAIDLTGNGGGSEWSTEAARLFVSGQIVRRVPLIANPNCDRSAIWLGHRPCPVLDHSDELETMTGEGVWDGPLFLLTDQWSASATEAFVVWLSSHHKVKVVGERTLGAGCGYINGGSAVQLESLPLYVMMPNCSRFTLDGVNEIEGLAPTIEIDWSDPNATARALARMKN